MGVLLTPRLILEPMTLELVEAVFRADREALEAIAGAKIPAAWPGRVLVERAFSASLEAIRKDPETRLWGDRLMITREGTERLVIGSIIFHGRPDASGVAEIGYGVEESWHSRA
jgi:ribosomal-protein-alanine N-acetyltransferase